MGVIQNSINSLLGTAAVMSKLSPTAQKRVEIREAETQVKKAANVINAVTKGETYDREIGDKALEIGLEAAEHQFKVNPTEENLKEWQTGLQTKRNIEAKRKEQQSPLLSLEKAKQRAQEWLQADQERARNAEYFRKPSGDMMADIKEIG